MEKDRRSLDESVMEMSGGLDMLSSLSSLRNRLTRRELWNAQVVRFEESWRKFKEEHAAVDFTDMIEAPLKGGIGPPAQVRIMFVDEAQDLSALELALIRSWVRSLDMLVIAGDSDQCIYHFRGSTPDAFLDPPVPEEHRRHLLKSHRLSKVIHEASRRIIHRVARREEFEFAPRGPGGEISRQRRATWKQPEDLLSQVDGLLSGGKSVMLLAPCGYMLAPSLAILRRAAVPFWNPYRDSAGQWNPLRGGGWRVAGFLAGVEGAITWGQLWGWLEMVDAKKAGLVRGAKATAKENGQNEFLKDVRLRTEELDGIFPARGSARPWFGDTRWLSSVLLDEGERRLGYAVRVAQKHGAAALERDPRCVVGSVHSVKGAEADAVAIFPDFSRAGAEEAFGSRAGMDAATRLTYVAVTRARDEVIVAEPVPWSELAMDVPTNGV